MGNDEGQSKATRPQRISVRCKREAVLRLMRGEDLELVSRSLGVTAGALSSWRDTALAAVDASLKSRQPDAKDEEIGRLQAKIGELTMEVELLGEKAARLDAGLPLARRRSRR